MQENTEGAMKKDNPEKLGTLGAQDTERRQTKQKNTHNYTQTKTNNVVKK